MARRAPSVAGEALLAALLEAPEETEENAGAARAHYIRARVGAQLLAEGLHDLKIIRKALTAPPPKS